VATMLPQVPNYLPQGAIDPFGSLLQGAQAGAQLANVEMARQQQAAQMAAMQQRAALEQQAAERAAANEAELQELQAVPFDQMSRQQQLRLLQLTNSEVSRAFISRQLEQIPTTVKANRARSYGGIVNALVLNPEVGVKRLRELAEAETNPQEKKAIEVALRAAEIDPFVAARTIHGMMDMLGGEETRKIADAVVNNLDRVGKPLYPRQPGKAMVVGGAVFMPETREFLQPPRQSQLLPPEEEAQRARIAAAGRAPSAPREQVVQAVDPDTGRTIFVSQSEALSRRLSPASTARPETPNVSEQQASTATRRLLQRAKEINAAVQRTPNAEAPSAVEAGMENTPLLSRATNLVRSADRQIVASAQDDVLDALLYLATGAAYNKEQLQQQKSAYLPVWSDDPATRAAKRQRLAQAIEGARVRAGRAWTPELEQELNKLLASPTMQSDAGAAPAGTGQWRLLPTTPR
jgi:hypothetical protein